SPLAGGRSTGAPHLGPLSGSGSHREPRRADRGVLVRPDPLRPAWRAQPLHARLRVRDDQLPHLRRLARRPAPQHTGRPDLLRVRPRRHLPDLFRGRHGCGAPRVGSAQGAVFVFSDLLSDHQLYLLVSSFSGAGFGNLLDNFSGTAFYLNQAHRVNWGVGAFRLRGLFYEGDFSTLYDETSGGVFGEIRYPLSRFTRIEAEYRIEHSNRFDITRPDLLENGSTEFHRVRWLASNYVSYVRDN